MSRKAVRMRTVAFAGCLLGTLAGCFGEGDAEVEQLRVEIRRAREAHKDAVSAAEERERKATEDMLAFQKKWEAEVAKRTGLAAENEQLKFWLNKYRERFGTHGDPHHGSPGKVLAVKGTAVTISVGSADGARVGDVYQLRRGSTYVGQIIVTKVEKDTSIGEFDTEFQGSGSPPQPGDIADPRGW